MDFHIPEQSTGDMGDSVGSKMLPMTADEVDQMYIEVFGKEEFDKWNAAELNKNDKPD